MPDMNNADAFRADVRVAEAKRQDGHDVAHATGRELLDKLRADWEVACKTAQDRFDAVKSDPTHPDHDAARKALNALQAPPNDREARDIEDDLVRAVDATYHHEVAALRVKHGIQSMPA